MKNYYFVLAFLVSILLQSCSTYQIPVDSFKEQFSAIDYNSLKTVKVQYPMGGVHDYLANPLNTIACVDKNGGVKELENSPSLEIRFTDMKNRKTIFYFDTVYLSDSLIIGGQSRFVPLERSISLNDIVKIEIQDGRKKFSYVE